MNTPAAAEESERLRVAVVQLCSGRDVDQNLQTVERLVAEAAARGAALVALPENFAFLGPSGELAAIAEALGAGSTPGPLMSALSALARRHRLHLLLGGLPTPSGEDAARVHNSAVLLDPTGVVAAVYHKLHLFDVAIAGGPNLRESAHVAPGREVVTAPLGGTRIGLSICYDLRFPELYRALTEQGAEVLCIPAAFTEHTGKDHWLPLLRARAIENQAFVLAPAQFGHHGGERVSYGKSCIVDPWGAVIAQVSDGAGIAVSELDLSYLRRVRRQLPCLEHRRL
ncbi:MAG: carbon-nitrogen hydrolase family protein [Proteobacteria bacterium]|nr:carbon-nitrogen hydrolase family protein [Pseudomonadota bacterium]